MDVSITGTLIWYYFICKREVWLMSRQINSFQDNPFLEIGRFIQAETYSRDRKSIRLENIELDIVQRKDGKLVVGEVKKSSKFVDSATMQLAFYLKRLKDFGIEMDGELLFPKEKKRILVRLNEKILKAIEKAEEDIKKIVLQEVPPKATKIKWCGKCSYFEFCFS